MANFDGNITLDNPNGIILKTGGSYCDKDIIITPRLEDAAFTPSSQKATYTTGDPYCGFGAVTVEAVDSEEKTVEPKNVAQTVLPSTNKWLSKVTVNAIQTESKSVTPTRSAQTVTPSLGKYLAIVYVGAIQTETTTITPAKGAQTVNPTSGKYFSAVTVEAIPSDYLIPTGEVSVTSNGTFDVAKYKTANVNIDLPYIEEVATASKMDSRLVSENAGRYYKYTGVTDGSGTVKYINGNIYYVDTTDE